MQDQQQTINDFFKTAKIHAACTTLNKLPNGFGAHLKLTPGTKISKIQSLFDELLLALNANQIAYAGLNKSNGTYYIEIIDKKLKSENFLNAIQSFESKDHDDYSLPINLGMAYNGSKILIDLAKNPNTLVGGTTGSGKSNVLHTIISNLLLYSNSYISVIDTKKIDFINYTQIPEIKDRFCIIDNYSDAIDLINILIELMETRYKWIAENVNNQQLIQPMILIIDEFADLSYEDHKGELRLKLTRLVQKSRAAQIYTVLATQRPSFEIITGTIKANFPARIACKTASKLDARIILDESGAETLSEPGDTIIKNYKYGFEKYKSFYTDPSNLYKLFNNDCVSLVN